ncbi:MAG: SPOR domain-containing protein [Gallionella sp.]|nr:SPOR domain-containing protein [Gallionella sp.]
MSRNTGNKPAAPRKSSSPLLTGILVGMVIGVGMAAGLAWYIMKSPSPFVQKEQVVSKPPPVAEKLAAPATSAVSDVQPATPASGVSDGKPRFEFYKVLTDKQDAPIAALAKPADKAQAAKPQPAVDKPQASDSKPIAANEPSFLQAASFSNADDAEKLKARLAMLGVETSIQTVTIPDKGVWHRVRSGPYKNTGEMNSARILLKQNGVDATPTR